eukprot:6570694-Prymnesium_polylepis.1
MSTKPSTRAARLSRATRYFRPSTSHWPRPNKRGLRAPGADWICPRSQTRLRSAAPVAGKKLLREGSREWSCCCACEAVAVAVVAAWLQTRGAAMHSAWEKPQESQAALGSTGRCSGAMARKRQQISS